MFVEFWMFCILIIVWWVDVIRLLFGVIVNVDVLDVGVWLRWLVKNVMVCRCRFF